MTGVEGTAVLAPVGGDPGEVRRVAAGLAAEADLLAALARTVRGLADPATTVWASPAGEAFGRRAGAVPGVVERVGHRYGVAAAALRRLAEALQEAQAEVAWSQRVHEEAWGPFLRAGEQMGQAENSADPGQRALAEWHRSEMVAHGERVQLAVRRHTAAHDTFAVADRACAAVLCGLLDDGLADSRLYDALTGTSRVAGQVSSAVGIAALLPPLRPLAPVATLAEGVGVAADAVVLVGYGDGDLTSVALAAGAAAAGGLGSVLKVGARATNAPTLAAAPTRSARRELRLTPADRLTAGLPGGWARRAGTGVHLVELPKPRPAQRWSPPPRSPAALRSWAQEQTAVRAAQWARARWVDDLTAIVQAEGASVRWHLAGVAAGGTAGGLRQGEALHGRLLDARDEGDLRESGSRHR